MAVPNYTVRSFDLAVGRTQEEVIGPGQKVDSVSVLRLPAGAVASLGFGSNRDFIPILPGDSYDVAGEVNGCLEPLDEGLYLANPVGAGTLTLLISFGGLSRAAAV